MTRIVPMTGRAIIRAVKAWHRHLPDIQGALFGCGIEVDGVLKGVACAGNPPRVLKGTGRFFISRVAVVDVKNGCSMLYGRICRAGESLGYSEAWTYTLPGEPGTSLRAAGFTDMGMTAGGEHDRPNQANRRRKPALHPEAKRRWMRRLNP